MATNLLDISTVDQNNPASIQSGIKALSEGAMPDFGYSVDMNINREQPLDEDEKSFMDSRTGHIIAVPKNMSDEKANSIILALDI